MGDNITENDSIRNIPILPALTNILLEIVQTQDIFHIRFQPEFSECDISVYEFRTYLIYEGKFCESWSITNFLMDRYTFSF